MGMISDFIKMLKDEHIGVMHKTVFTVMYLMLFIGVSIPIASVLMVLLLLVV